MERKNNMVRQKYVEFEKLNNEHKQCEQRFQRLKTEASIVGTIVVEKEREIEQLKQQLGQLTTKAKNKSKKRNDIAREKNQQIVGLKDENKQLKFQLKQQNMGKGIESGFIKEEDLLTKKWPPFRQQIFKDLFDDLFYELEKNMQIRIVKKRNQNQTQKIMI